MSGGGCEQGYMHLYACACGDQRAIRGIIRGAISHVPHSRCLLVHWLFGGLVCGDWVGSFTGLCLRDCIRWLLRHPMITSLCLSGMTDGRCLTAGITRISVSTPDLFSGILGIKLGSTRWLSMCFTNWAVSQHSRTSLLNMKYSLNGIKYKNEINLQIKRFCPFDDKE